MDHKKEIKKFAKHHFKLGYDKEKIKKELVRVGFKKKLVHEAVDEAHNLHTSKGNYWIILSALAGAFAVGLLLFYISLPSEIENKKCFAKDCFSAFANRCQDAEFDQAENRVLVKYSTSNCVLVKKIDSVAADEPTAVRDLFTGRQMSCKYDSGEFDSSLIDEFLNGINNCEGSLKDAVVELRSR